jgi:DNA helicase II / ATP-dependent DNA helicase PcrA
MNMNLSEEQKLILNDPSGFTQIIAAAGSGKTFTIIELVASLIHDKNTDQSSILMITFSRKAANEMRSRLNKRIGTNKVMIYTFHAYCLRILKRYNPKFKLKIKIITPEKKIHFYKEMFKKEKFTVGGIPYSILLSNSEPNMTDLFPELEIKIKNEYQSYKDNHHLVDFEDLVSLYVDGLKRKEEWALHAKREFSTILVDEFQDTDPKQVEWLKLLEPKNLIVVGDDWQAIYGFRGATTEPFLDFGKYFSPCKKLYLSTNYRSDIHIIKASAIPIQNNKKNIFKNVLPFSNNNGSVQIIKLESELDWRKYISILTENSNNRLLVRTNFRIKQLSKIGVPHEQICTIHSSKGLEYPSVFIDLTDGWETEKMDKINLEEERRILYVGLSRAIHSLWIFGKQTYKRDSLESIFFNYFHSIVY